MSEVTVLTREFKAFKKETLERFDDIDERFERLFTYLEKRFEQIDAQLAEHAAILVKHTTKLENHEALLIENQEALRSIYTNLDAYAKRADDYFLEFLMLTKQYDRHDQWIKQLAAEANVQLTN